MTNAAGILRMRLQSLHFVAGIEFSAFATSAALSRGFGARIGGLGIETMTLIPAAQELQRVDSAAQIAVGRVGNKLNRVL